MLHYCLGLRLLSYRLSTASLSCYNVVVAQLDLWTFFFLHKMCSLYIAPPIFKMKTRLKVTGRDEHVSRLVNVSCLAVNRKELRAEVMWLL